MYNTVLHCNSLQTTRDEASCDNQSVIDVRILQFTYECTVHYGQGSPIPKGWALRGKERGRGGIKRLKFRLGPFLFLRYLALLNL